MSDEKRNKVYNDRVISIEEPDSIAYDSNQSSKYPISNSLNSNSNINSQYTIYAQQGNTKGNINSSSENNSLGNISNIDYIESELDGNLEKYYVKCAKETTDLVPREMKGQVKFWNSIFLLSSLGLIGYNTAYFIAFYPDSFSAQHINKVKLFTAVSLLTSLSSYYFRQEVYKKSLRLLQNNYSDQEIKQLIKRFYQTNTLSAQQAISNSYQGKS